MVETPKDSAKVQLIELRNGGVSFRQLLSEDFARGLSPRLLQAKYGLHFTSIYAYARAYGLKPPDRRRRCGEPELA